MGGSFVRGLVIRGREGGREEGIEGEREGRREGGREIYLNVNSPRPTLWV